MTLNCRRIFIICCYFQIANKIIIKIIICLIFLITNGLYKLYRYTQKKYKFNFCTVSMGLKWLICLLECTRDNFPMIDRDKI